MLKFMRDNSNGLSGWEQAFWMIFALVMWTGSFFAGEFLFELIHNCQF